MEGEAKNKIILVLSLLIVIFFLISVNSCRNAAKEKKLLNQEMLKRMELEEEMLILSNRNSGLEQKINQLQETITQERTVNRLTQQELNQEISKLKEALVSPGGSEQNEEDKAYY